MLSGSFKDPTTVSHAKTLHKLSPGFKPQKSTKRLDQSYSELRTCYSLFSVMLKLTVLSVMIGDIPVLPSRSCTPT